MIGSGKSTVGRLLADKMQLSEYQEKVDANPFFSLFLENPAEWAFHSQLFFLLAALKEQRKAALDPEGSVLERIADEAYHIFSQEQHQKGWLSDKQLKVLQETLVSRGGSLSPDIIVFLEATPETLLQRIQTRGRQGEDNYDLDYLTALSARYQDWKKALPSAKLITVDVSRCDLREDKELSALAETIKARLSDNTAE